MKKKFAIEVDCANCAAKIETAVKELPGVTNAIFGRQVREPPDIAQSHRRPGCREHKAQPAGKAASFFVFHFSYVPPGCFSHGYKCSTNEMELQDEFFSRPISYFPP